MMIANDWMEINESSSLNLLDKDVSDAVMEGKAMYTVVLADSDPILRETYLHFLEEDGVEVFATRNGDEAYRLCESLNPDLVITCVHLWTHGMNERSLIDALHDAFPELPILAMANSENEMMVNQAHRMGVAVLIRKPSDGEYLVSIAESILGTSPGICQDSRLASATLTAPATTG